jgi:ABC-2 type transport system permease protein
MKTTLLYAKLQLMRLLRDPVTLIVLFAIPVLLLVLFGAFIGRGNAGDVSLKVAVINESSEQFASEFVDQLRSVDILSVQDESMSRSEAEAKLKDNQLDGILELPSDFGQIVDGKPTGIVRLLADSGDRSSIDILMGVMTRIAEHNNAAITGSEAPIRIEQSSVEGTASKPVDVLYPMFTSMAIMMVGIFAVASAIPTDKKTGILRRMRVTPFRASQMIGGIVLAYIILSFMVVAVMTSIAMIAFGMEMRGDWLNLSALVLISSMVMIALGVMIGGWAKNTTQSDIYGQIIFIGSLAFSGLWLPRALMPEWLRDITAFLPLTPLIEGMERIVVVGLTVADIGFQLAVLAGWFIIAFVIGMKTFRWE